jgi:dihydropteroate synthase
MHIEGPPRADREPAGHRDPVAHLKGWFQERIQAALEHGVAEEQIALDPGLDFDLSVDDDLEILRHLGELRDLGRPLFVALSRKDFLGAVVAGSWEGRAAASEREWATAAAAALAITEGAEMVRLHDRSALDALRTAAAISGRRLKPAQASTAANDANE